MACTSQLQHVAPVGPGTWLSQSLYTPLHHQNSTLWLSVNLDFAQVLEILKTKAEFHIGEVS